MVAITVTTNIPDVIRSLDRLRADVADQALRQAMNRTVDRGRTEMARAVAAEFAIKVGEVRAQLKVRKVTRATARADFEAALEAFGRRAGKRSRNVMLFGAKPAPGKGTKVVRFSTPRGWVTRTVPVGGGVSVKIKRSGPRKVIAGAFIANKGRTVFVRAPGASRLPIQAVETVDVPQMFNTRTINAKVVRRMGEIFEIEAGRAINLAIARFNR